MHKRAKERMVSSRGGVRKLNAELQDELLKFVSSSPTKRSSTDFPDQERVLLTPFALWQLRIRPHRGRRRSTQVQGKRACQAYSGWRLPRILLRHSQQRTHHHSSSGDFATDISASVTRASICTKRKHRRSLRGGISSTCTRRSSI